MPKRIAVVGALGHTLQVTETEDQLIVQKVWEPFLSRWELPENAAANLASAKQHYVERREKQLAQESAALMTCSQCGLEKPAALFSEFADPGLCSLCRALARREQAEGEVSR